MSDRDNGVAIGSGNIRTSAFDQRFSRNKELLVIVLLVGSLLRLVYSSCCEAFGPR
ncbi:hypothetical protein MHB56_26385 [Paenibacillus sp. FSL H8-0315]|uniref:hypothetical protein n=1 Tax=Paenibacillus sp. FSL H8-0315 TaxID=2921384 RepID=UPI0030FC7F9D